VNLERLYLDYNATSPLSRSVIDWLKSGDFLFANPASQHSDGKASRKRLSEARAFVYRCFGQREADARLFFHSGATEAFHTLAYSFSETARLAGRDLLICVSRLDHPAVTSLQEKYFGPHVKFFELKRGRNLRYRHAENFEALRDRKDDNPELLILYHHLWVHNETGQVSPLEELRDLRGVPDLTIHVDAVQAPGKIPDWRCLAEGDVWSFSAHKFGALKGVGFTFLRAGVPFHPLILGGGQQTNLRSGTENVQGVISAHLALRDLEAVDVSRNRDQRRRLLRFLEAELAGIGGLIADEPAASNTIYFYLDSLTSDVALAMFDLAGVALSAGSACSSGAAKASPLLLQRGLPDVARNGLRISWGFALSDADRGLIEERFRAVFSRIRARTTL
jgi:cysteine desulfurase